MSRAATVTLARQALPTAPQALHPDRALWDQEVGAFLGALRQERKSPNTLDAYGDALENFARYRTAQGWTLDPTAVTRREVQAWTADLTTRYAAATSRGRTIAVGRFFAWLVGEWALVGEHRPSPFAGVKAAKLAKVAVPSLAEAEVDALLAACSGTRFEDLRDRAILTLALSTGLRLSEIAGLLVEDVVDPVRGYLHVDAATAKGEKARLVAFGGVAQDALRHYMRARSRHPHADVVESVGIRADNQREGHPLWLVTAGSGYVGRLGRAGIGQMLSRRAAAAGLGHIHPHQLRHTFAHTMLAGGVPEGAVMALGGWTTRTMMDRYGADLAQERAVAAYRDPLARGKRR